MNEFAMMSTDAEQARCLWYCLLFGFALGIGYTPFAWWRSASRRHRLLQAAVDILCCLIGGTLLFFFVLAVNGGTLRGAMVLSTALGFVMENKTVGRLLLLLFRTSARLLQTAHTRLATMAVRTQMLAKKFVIFSKKGLHSLCTLVYNRK